MKKLLLIPMLLSTHAYAMFCPTNFTEISLGDSTEKVIQTCGPPDEKKLSVKTANLPQEWTYYVNPSLLKQANPIVPPANPLKMTVALTNDKIANITVNGQSLVSTPVCGKPLKNGDSLTDLKSACGNPQFIAQGQPMPGQSTQDIKVTEFIYKGTSTTSLIFEDDKLTERK